MTYHVPVLAAECLKWLNLQVVDESLYTVLSFSTSKRVENLVILYGDFDREVQDSSTK